MLRKPQIKSICIISFGVAIASSLLLLNVKPVSSISVQVACQSTLDKATPYLSTTSSATGIVATVFRGTLPPTSTSTITPSPAFIGEADVTLTGEVFPAVNCGPDGGLGSPNRDYQTARQPMEYHLIDPQGNDVRLSFDTENLYTIYKEKWLVDNHSLIASIQEIMTRTPDYYRNYPKFAIYNAVWQDLAGRWVMLSGRRDREGVFYVNSFQVVPTPSDGSFITSVVNTGAAKLGSRQVTVTGQFVVTNQNPRGSITTPGFVCCYVYQLKDINGWIVDLIIYHSQPNNATRIITSDRTLNFQGMDGKWMKFTGWMFSPPRGHSYSGNQQIEVQIAQEIAPPKPITATPGTKQPN